MRAETQRREGPLGEVVAGIRGIPPEVSAPHLTTAGAHGRHENTSPARLRVAFLTPRYVPFVGGAEIALGRLISGLASSTEILPRVLTCLTDSIGTLLAGEDEETPEVIRLGRSSPLPPFHDDARAQSAAAIVRGLEARVAEFHLIYLNNHVFLQDKTLARRLFALDKPIVLKLIYGQALEKLEQVLPFLLEAGGRLRLHCVSHALIAQARACGFAEEQLFYCPNAMPAQGAQACAQHGELSARERLGIGAQALVMAFVGRFAPQKNLPGVISLFQRTAQHRARRGLETHLLMIGYAYFPEMERLVAQLKTQVHNVHWLGQLSNHCIAETLSAADCLVLASHDEGLSNALLEGMALGLCPVVPGSLSGVQELITHESGFLYELHALEDAAERLSELTRDELAVRGLRSRARVEGLCSPTRVTALHERLYKTLEFVQAEACTLELSPAWRS